MASLLNCFDDLLQCTLCYEKFTLRQDDSNPSRVPKTLLCQHTFCETCVKVLLGRGSKILCPICRDTTLTNGGVNSLRDNFITVELIDCTRKAAMELMLNVGRPKCIKHDSTVIEYYCTECDEEGCKNCLAQDHAGHTIIIHEEAIEYRKAKISTATTNFRNELETCIDRKYKLIGDYISQKSNLIHKVNEEIESIILKIRSRQMEVIAEIESRTTFLCNFQQEKILSMEAKMVETLSSIDKKIRNSDPSNFMSISKEILENFDQIETQAYNANTSPSLANSDEIKFTSESSIIIDDLKDIYIPQLFQLNNITCNSCNSICNDNHQIDMSSSTLISSSNSLSSSTLFTRTSTPIPYNVYVSSNNNYNNIDRRITNFTNRLNIPLQRSDGFIGTGQGHGHGQLSNPRAVALLMPQTDRTMGSIQLFVSDYGNHRIQVYNSITGQYIRSIGGGRGSGMGQLNYPLGIEIFTPGYNKYNESQLFVVDNRNCRIQVYNAITGQFLRSIGSGKGSGIGQLSDPIGITIQPIYHEDRPNNQEIHIFISDAGNNRIQVFHGITGQFIRSISIGKGSGPNQLNYPLDIHIFNIEKQSIATQRWSMVSTTTWINDAISTSNTQLLYIADNRNYRIQVYNPSTGLFIRSIGNGKGSGPGQLLNPRGVYLCMMPDTSTTSSNNTGVCNINTTMMTSSSSSVHSPGTGSYTPHLFVSDICTGTTSRIQVYHAITGQYLRSIDLSNRGQWSGHVGMIIQPAIDGKHLLIVTDSVNNRVQILSL